MVSEIARKALLYVGIAFLVLGVAMLAFAGGGMIIMDAPLIVIGAVLTVWAIIEGRRVASA